MVCKASLRDGGLETVGDLVCTTRGTPKPTWDASPERMAAECTMLLLALEREACAALRQC